MTESGSSKHSRTGAERPVIGWREWVGLPDLGIQDIKAKIDTGARTSALHAFNIRYTERAGETWVRFDVHPLQKNTKTIVSAKAPLLEERHITNSGGHRSLRPVIETTIEILGTPHTCELTLVSRDQMGFRMLLGREAIRKRYLVDPGRSYLGDHRPKKKKKKKKT